MSLIAHYPLDDTEADMVATALDALANMTGLTRAQILTSIGNEPATEF